MDKTRIMHIDKQVFTFLQKIKKNNNREWFTENKSEYEKAHQSMIVFADDLLTEMEKFDDIETVSGKKSLMRIYKDIRFSKDKTPYKTHWGGGFKRATAARRGGFYYHIEPGNSFVGGGFWGPNKDDLHLIRQQIELNADPLRKVINSKAFKSSFGELKGEQLKTAPKGFDKEHADIDLLRYKQFLISTKLDDKDLMSDQGSKIVAKHFKAMLPFFDVMSEYLTTNLNGESTID